MAQNQQQQQHQQLQQQIGDSAKEKYLKFFMVDFLEFNLRKITVENTEFCSDKCHLFDNLGDQTQEKQQFSCFEKCLGKFTDSYEYSLDIFGSHLKTLNVRQVYSHADKESQEKRFLMGEGITEPVYDKPTLRKKRASADQD